MLQIAYVETIIISTNRMTNFNIFTTCQSERIKSIMLDTTWCFAAEHNNIRNISARANSVFRSNCARFSQRINIQVWVILAWFGYAVLLLIRHHLHQHMQTSEILALIHDLLFLPISTIESRVS